MIVSVGHHSTSDDSFAYRARQEVEDWKRIGMLNQDLLSNLLLTH